MKPALFPLFSEGLLHPGQGHRPLRGIPAADGESVERDLQDERQVHLWDDIVVHQESQAVQVLLLKGEAALQNERVGAQNGTAKPRKEKLAVPRETAGPQEGRVAPRQKLTRRGEQVVLLRGPVWLDLR